eukprot:gene1867-2536_t
MADVVEPTVGDGTRENLDAAFVPSSPAGAENSCPQGEVPPEPPEIPLLGLDWFKGVRQRGKSLRYMAWRGWRCALELTGGGWKHFMGTPVATFTEAASLISRVHDGEDTRDMCSFFEVISDDSCAYWDIDRKVELLGPVTSELLDARHRETLALSIAGIKAFLEREYMGQQDIPDDAFMVLGACTAEKSSFHVLLRVRLGGAAERGEFRRRLMRQKATVASGIADLLRWVDEAPYGKTQCLRTVYSCKTGKRNWLLPVEGWGAAAALEDFFVTNVPANAETLCPACEEVGGASLPRRAPVCAGGAAEDALHVLTPGEAATAEALAREAVTKLRGHAGVPPRAIDEVAERAGAPAAVQLEAVDKRRRVDAGGSAPDAAEMGSCGAGDRHAANRGTDGRAPTMTDVDGSSLLVRPAAGCAGVTGVE